MFILTGFDGENADNGLYFTPDGQTLVSCGEGGLVHLWDVPGRRHRKTLRAHTSFASGLCLIPGTTLFASGSWDETVRVWDHATGRRVKSFDLGHSVVGLAASPDGSTLAAVGGEWLDFEGEGNPIRRWDVATWKKKPPLGQHETQVGVVLYTPDGRRLLTGDADRLLHIWDAETGEAVTKVRHTGWIQGLAAHGDIVAVAAGRRVSLYEIPAGRSSADRVAVIDSHKGTALTAAFSFDGGLLATGGKDGCVRVWDMKLQRPRQTYRWKIGEIYAVTFAPDGMTMAAAGDGRLVVWDVD